MPQELRKLLRNILVRPPKKYTAALVADIFPHVKSNESLDDLLYSGYFHVIWNFFHADVTNNHLQLILLLAYYELDFCNQTSCLETLASDKSKLHDLVVRVLQATMDPSANNVTLKGSAFLFLSALVRYDVSFLRENKLYAKWNNNVLDQYLRTFSSLETVQYPSYTKCFIYLCICWAVSDEEMKSKIRDLHVALFFTSGGMGEALSKRLGDLLSLVCYEKSDFVSNQVLFQDFGPSFDFLTLAFSKLDVSHTQLNEALEDVGSEQLTKIARVLNIGIDLPTKFLVEAITTKVLGPRITRSTTFQISRYTEFDLFDLFDTANPELAINPLIPYTLELIEDNITEYEQLILSWKVSKQIHNHLMSTLGRLAITDGTKAEGIKGKSKYFHVVETAEFTGAFGNITIKAPVTSLSDAVILLDVHRPNDRDERLRIKKFGIQAARVAKVLSYLGKLVKVRVEHLGEATYNAFISLPENVSTNNLRQLNDAIKCSKKLSIFENQGNPDESAIEVFHLKMDVLENIEGVKFEDKDDSHKHFQYNGVKFNSNFAMGMFNLGESHALLEMLTSRVLVVKADTNSGRSSLTNCFLHTLQRNWPNERCLVILPSRLAITQFTLFPGLESVVKVGLLQNVTDVIRRRSKLLKKVSEISKILKLDEYAFDTNAVNALMLFTAHIVPKWEDYLSLLNKSKRAIERYPFERFNFDEEEDYEIMLTAVLEHYAVIKKTFADLQKLLPLDKVDQDDVQAIQQFLVKTSKYVISSIEDLKALESFDNIISFSSSPEVLTPLVQGSKRVIFFTPEYYVGLIKSAESVSNSPVELSTIGVRKEIAALTGSKSSVKSEYNPGFKHTVQHITVPEVKSQVNIDEAKYAVYLFQYFRLLGYPHHQLLVMVQSPYMNVLIEEILEEHKIYKTDVACDDAKGFKFGWPLIQSCQDPFSCDYAIVLCHLGLSMREYFDVAKSARLGLYFIGSSLTAPYKIRLGDLEVYTGAHFSSGNDSRAKTEAYEMDGAEHMGEYVEQMTKTRMGG